MAHYITTHNSEGKGIFSNKLAPEQHSIPVQGDSEKGSLQMLYNIDNFSPNLSTEEDIDLFDHIRTKGLPPGMICPPNGASVVIVNLTQAPTPWHRTMTLDVIYIVEGIVELHLDSGEMKTLKAGDAIVQRGTMHKWQNVTPNNGPARLLGVALPIEQPLEVGGESFSTEWKF